MIRLLCNPRAGRRRAVRSLVNVLATIVIISVSLPFGGCITETPGGEDQSCEADSECIDDIFCNGVEKCFDGFCIDGDPVQCPPEQPCDEVSEGCGKRCVDNMDCNDGNECTDDTCVQGRCRNAFNIVDCDDGELCTVGDVCTEGVCTGTEINDCCEVDEDCEDDNECTNDRCGDDNLCLHSNNEDDCDDEDFCTDPDICVDGECAGVPVLDCCNSDDECDEGESCVDHECIVLPPTAEELALERALTKLGIAAAVTTLPAAVAQAFIDSALNELGPPDPAQEITNFGIALAHIAQTAAGLKIAIAVEPTRAQLQGGFEDNFPCGPGENGYTVCPDSANAFVEGDYLVVVATFGAAVPLSDANRFYQYAAVFDSDGNPNNNFVPLDAFPGDFFQNSDKWYAAQYDPDTGWTLDVTDARNNDIQPVASQARLIFDDNAMVLLVPVGELEVSDPAFRVTAFCHDGGFGFDGGFSTGDYEPRPMEPLQSFE